MTRYDPSSLASRLPSRRVASLPSMTRVERYERRSEIPMILLAVAFLIAYAVPVLDPDLDPDLRASLNVLSWAVWAAFAIDFAIRLWLAEHRWHYAKRHWYDVALVVLPFLRPLRLLRLLALARILNRSAAGSLVGRVSTYVIGVAIIAVGLGALAVLDAEQDAKGANITNYGDALWWASTTVTTVGYGDPLPGHHRRPARRPSSHGRRHRNGRCGDSLGRSLDGRAGAEREVIGRRPRLGRGCPAGGCEVAVVLTDPVRGEVARAGALTLAAAPLHRTDPALRQALPRTELALDLLAVVEGDQDVGSLVGPVGAVAGVVGWLHAVSASPGGTRLSWARPQADLRRLRAGTAIAPARTSIAFARRCAWCSWSRCRCRTASRCLPASARSSSEVNRADR